MERDEIWHGKALAGQRKRYFRKVFSLKNPHEAKREDKFMKYECPCGYVYDPEVGDPDSGIAPGTAFEDIPDDWVCPVCGLGKDAFTAV